MPAKPRNLYRNPISIIGALIAAVAIANILFLFLADLSAAHANPYVGILAYMVVPAIMLFGIALFFGGIVWERKRRRKEAPDEIPEYPTIDLNKPRQRHLVVLFILGGIIFVFISLLGSYRGYEYTDSDAFCGTLCHNVMIPEYTAYKASPHARVGCVGCHVGTGATWYVKSKLSGAYQVYATTFNKYPRPIPTPVENLRPAQETCEQCHWPEKFWGAQLKTFTHYAYDEQNTPRETQMLIKTGGGSPTGGVTAGIHWHMNIANEITYVSDDKRQKMEWVRIKDNQGRVTEYTASDSKLTPEQIASAQKRRMDCIDCHNRPTHIYVPPDRSVDRALLAGRINSSLPFAKMQAVDALTKEYKTTDEAVAEIAKQMNEYYAKTYPDLVKAKKPMVDQAIATTQDIYKCTIFPEMKVDWRVHPDNIGHFYSPGCFRCHDNEHRSNDGKVITKDCNICHTVIGQKLGGAVMAQINPATFVHPVDLGDMQGYVCGDCHTGGVNAQ